MTLLQDFTISNGQINFKKTIGLGTELDMNKASKLIQNKYS